MVRQWRQLNPSAQGLCVRRVQGDIDIKVKEKDMDPPLSSTNNLGGSTFIFSSIIPEQICQTMDYASTSFSPMMLQNRGFKCKSVRTNDFPESRS